MSDTVLPTPEAILRLCAEAAPKAWSPKLYAQSSGVDRNALNIILNDLRVASLVRLTDWEKTIGQGYVLTELGDEVLNNPIYLAQLRAGLVKPKPPLPVREDEEETTYDRGEAARQSLFEPSPPRVMPILLLVNLIAFGLSLYVAVRAGIPVAEFAGQGNSRVLHELGALSAIDLIHGEWWRLLTCCFLHFGVMHLLMNMASLYFLSLLESLWGSFRYLLIYLISGIGGSCIAMLWHPGTPTEPVLLAGASGAIWGLMTSSMAWLFMNRSHLPPENVSRAIPMFGFLLMANVGMSFLPGISASAHFGGGAVGFVLATLLHVHRIAPPPRRTLATMLIVLLPILLIGAVSEAIKKDPRWQLLADQDNVRQRALLAVHFKKEVLPAVDLAEIKFEELERDAYIVTEKAPAARVKDARLPKLKENLKDAKGLLQAGIEKLGEKPLADERLEKARQTGRDYLHALLEQADRFEKLIDESASWNQQERDDSKAKIKNTREAWKTARGSL